MDPLYIFGARGTRHVPVIYDSRFWWSHTTEKIPRVVETFSEEKFVDEDLSEYYNNEIKGLSHLSRKNGLIVERSDPLKSIGAFLKNKQDSKYYFGNNTVFQNKVEDVTRLYFDRVFNIDPSTVKIIQASATLRNVPNLKTIFGQLIKNKDLPQDLLLESGASLYHKKEDADMIYFMSFFYKKVTIIQPAIINKRYILFRSRNKIKVTKKILKQVDAIAATKGTSGIFESLPEAFTRWLIFLNNVYIGLVSESLLKLKESQLAYANKEKYSSGISIDQKKVVRYLRGEQVYDNPVVDGNFLRFNVKRSVPVSLHIYNNQIAESESIQRSFDLETDPKTPYSKDAKLETPGHHWGARKDLMADLDFISNHVTSKNVESVQVLYFAAKSENETLKQFGSFGHREFLFGDSGIYAGRLNFKVVDVDTDFSYNEESLKETVKRAVQADEIIVIMNFRASPAKEGLVFENISREEMFSKYMEAQKTIFENLKDMIATTKYKGQSFNIKDVKCSMFFRLPFEKDTFDFYEGDLRIHPWSKVKSTAVRLWIDGKSKNKTYKLETYEQVLFHHNLQRGKNFGKVTFGNYGVCYDCHLDSKIVERVARDVVAVSDTDIAVESARKEVLDNITKFFGKNLREQAKTAQRKVSFFRTILDQDGRKYNPMKEIALNNAIFGDVVKNSKNQTVVRNAIHSKIQSGVFDPIDWHKDVKKSSIKKYKNVKDVATSIAVQVDNSNKIAFVIESSVETISFSPKILPRFVAVKGRDEINERELKYPRNNLRDNKIIQERAFSILRRFRAFYVLSMFLGPRNFYIANKMLPGLEVGRNMLSSHMDEKNKINTHFDGLFPDFAENFSSFQGDFADTNDYKVMSYFAPTILESATFIITKLVKKFDNTSEDVDFAAVIIVPSEFVSKIKAIQDKKSRDFKSKLMNYNTMFHISTDNTSRKLIVLKTPSSSLGTLKMK